MPSDRLERALRRHGIHYGWVVAGVTFLAMLVAAGSMGAPGVLLIPLRDEFGWSTADISVALGLRLLLFGAMAPFAAALMNRFGLRRITLASQALVVFGLAASLAMTNRAELVVLWGVVLGIGTGMTALVLGATVATRWFSARRGLVLGLLTASTATGQLVFMPIVAALADAAGWRAALVFLCGAIAVAALAVMALLRDRPSDLGLAPFGHVGAPPPAPSGPSASPARAALEALRDASRTRVFWVLFGTFFVCGATTNGLVQTHLVPLCADFGVPAVEAAWLLALIGLFDFIGTVGSGWLSDRYDNRWLLFIYYGLRSLALLFLPLSDFTMIGLGLFAVFYGLDWVATVPPTIRLTSQHFGPERAAIVFGWIFMGHQFGAAAAAYGAGTTRTMAGTYLPAFLAAGILCLIAAIAILALGTGRSAGARRAAGA